MDALLNKERAMEIMARESIDALVARLSVNRYYLSGYRGPATTASADDACYWAVLPRDPQALPLLVLPEAEVQRFESGQASGGDQPANNVCGYTESEDATGVLAGCLRAAGLETGRLVADDMRTSDWLAERGIDGAGVMYRPELFNDIRLLKTSAEIELMKQAAHINEMAFLLTADSVEAGSGAEELENLYMMTLAQQGGRGVQLLCGTDDSPLSTISATAPAGLAALGCYRGYHAAFGRCVAVGEPGRAYRKQHAYLLAGWEKARELLQPGKTYAELSQVVGDTVRKAGLSEFRNPRVHSTGLEFADDPVPFGSQPRALTDRAMAPDMVVTVTMSHADPGVGTFHIEDTVRITTYGHERLSKTDLSIRVSGTTE